MLPRCIHISREQNGPAFIRPSWMQSCWLTSVSLCPLSSVVTSNHPVFIVNTRPWLHVASQMITSQQCSPWITKQLLVPINNEFNCIWPKMSFSQDAAKQCISWFFVYRIWCLAANNSCEEHSLKAKSTSLKSKVSCGGKMQLLHTTASFETAAYWAVQSFTLGRAMSITTDWLSKSLGRHHKINK